MSIRRTVFKRRSLPSRTTISRCRLAKVQSHKFLSGTPVCTRHYSFMWDLLEAIKRKEYFKVNVESNKVYMELRGVIKQTKAQLAKLDDLTGGEAGTLRKSNKKSNLTIAEASQADTALQADIMAEIKQAQEASDKAKAKGEEASTDMFWLFTRLPAFVVILIIPVAVAVAVTVAIAIAFSIAIIISVAFAFAINNSVALALAVTISTAVSLAFALALTFALAVAHLVAIAIIITVASSVAIIAAIAIAL
jgi:hypothetical protein